MIRPAKQTFRSPGVVLLATVAAAVLGGEMLDQAKLSSGIPPKIGYLAIAMVCAVSLVRGLMAGVVVGPDSVKVRGFTRTHTVPWSAVEGFGFTASNPMNNTVYIAVRLKGGRYLKTGGLSGRSPHDPKALGIVAQMEVLKPS